MTFKWSVLHSIYPLVVIPMFHYYDGWDYLTSEKVYWYCTCIRIFYDSRRLGSAELWMLMSVKSHEMRHEKRPGPGCAESALSVLPPCTSHKLPEIVSASFCFHSFNFCELSFHWKVQKVLLYIHLNKYAVLIPVCALSVCVC